MTRSFARDCFRILLIGVLSAPSIFASADIVSIVATADGTVDVGTFNPGVDDTSDSISSARNFTLRIQHGIYEFDLSSMVPSGATINSATFSGYTTLIVDSSYDVSFTGYVETSLAGIQMGDATASGTLIGNFGTGQLATGSSFGLQLLDLTGLQTAVDTGNVFGIRTTMDSNQDTWLVRSTESSVGPPPTLTIDFTAVPEPSTATGVALVVGGFLIKRRRR